MFTLPALAPARSFRDQLWTGLAPASLFPPESNDDPGSSKIIATLSFNSWARVVFVVPSNQTWTWVREQLSL